PELRALFLGDIISEECEVSWIRQGDVSPLLAAFPRLEHFKVRGSARLAFGGVRHDHLRVLAGGSGGPSEAVLAEIYAADFPRLEHLELWLGSPWYGATPDPVPLVPLLRGRTFPRLRYLGLRNSLIADLVAQAVALAPVLRKLKVLDLSMG